MSWVISISSTHSASASFLALPSAFRFLPLIFSIIKVYEVASIFDIDENRLLCNILNACSLSFIIRRFLSSLSLFACFNFLFLFSSSFIEQPSLFTTQQEHLLLIIALSIYQITKSPIFAIKVWQWYSCVTLWSLNFWYVRTGWKIALFGVANIVAILLVFINRIRQQVNNQAYLLTNSVDGNESKMPSASLLLEIRTHQESFLYNLSKFLCFLESRRRFVLF